MAHSLNPAPLEQVLKESKVTYVFENKDAPTELDLEFMARNLYLCMDTTRSMTYFARKYDHDTNFRYEWRNRAWRFITGRNKEDAPIRRRS